MASPSILGTFVAHPSVRMKGTEDNWHPVNCDGVGCEFEGLHMHCPMCTKESNYTDPVILKAHYRVKHVDKGVEFAGLKVLRCCRSCEIIGVISGYKNFKGPHWHCYRCRNGFNRRDEALKHFKTHFKNPQTTFQIQLVQDLNQGLSLDMQQGSSGNSNLNMSTTPTTISLPSLGQTHGNRLVTVTSQQETAMATNGISVAANETIDSNAETIVLIETADGNLGPSVHSLQANTGSFPALIQSGGTSAPDNHVLKANLLLVQEKMKLEQRIEHLQREKMEIEHRYKVENQRLKARIDQLTVSNSNLKQQVETLRKASAGRLPDSDQSELEELVTHMEEQHSNILRHHLSQLRLYWSSQHTTSVNSELQENVVTSPQNVHNTVATSQQRVQIIPMASAEALELERIINQSNGNQQNLTLSQDVTMETAEGSYQVTLLPQVSATAESARDLDNAADTRAESEMTNLSSVAVPYSDERTLEGDTNDEVSTDAESKVTSDSQSSEEGVSNVQEEQNGGQEKRPAEEDEMTESQIAKKSRNR